MDDFKIKLRSELKAQYSHELLNNLFKHPYTKVEYIASDMQLSRQTASKYLDRIVKNTRLLKKVRIGRANYYINEPLYNLPFNHEGLYKADD